MGAGRRYMPNVTITLHQFDSILAYSGYDVSVPGDDNSGDDGDDDDVLHCINTSALLLSPHTIQHAM